MLRLTTLVLVALMAQQAPPNTALVVGRVLDQTDGKPISGAVVEMASEAVVNGTAASTNPPRLQMTDGRGRFVFRELAGGIYQIRVTAGGNGYSPNGFIQNSFGFPIGRYLEGGYGQRRPGGSLQPLLLADGQGIPDLVISLWRGAAINGVVMDDTGEPVVGTVVGAAQVSSDGRLINGPTSRTDDRGMYRLSALVPGRYIVFVPQTTTAMSAESAETAMQRIAALTEAERPGTPATPVPDLTGIRVGGSLVKSGSSGLIDGNLMPRRVGETMFVFQTTFYPSAVALVSSTPLELASGDDKSGVDVSLQPVKAVSVSGTVLSGGAPAPGVRLRIVPSTSSPDAALFDTAVSRTDELGRFAFPLVPIGNYTVMSTNDPLPARPAAAPVVHGPTGAGGPGAWVAEPVSVGPEGVKDLVLTLKPGLILRGQFEFSGAGPRPSAADIANMLVGVRSISPRARSDAFGGGAQSMAVGAGSFAAIGISPGRYVFRAIRLPAGLPWRIQSVTAGGREINDLPFELTEDVNNVRVVFTDRPAAVTGRVTTADPGDGAAAVLLFPADRSLWPDARSMTRRFRIARTAASGDFSIPDVPPGDYVVVAVADTGTADWPDAAFLAKLLPEATPLRIAAGERPVMALTVKKAQ